MSTLESWTVYKTDRQIIDIGGSLIDKTFVDQQLPKAFLKQGDFPKEIDYTTFVDDWNAVANQSYQTSLEMTIIQNIADRIVGELTWGTHIIDLGADNSKKFEPYVRAFIKQNKECTYVALNLNYDSLVEHINNVKATFPNVMCIGLWGSFEQGDVYFKETRPMARLFLSLGSLFYNAPNFMVMERCIEFKSHLQEPDRLVVNQEGPISYAAGAIHAAYTTEEYRNFFITYLQGLHDNAGIKDVDPESAWTVQSKLNKAMHCFDVTANHDMYCENFKIVVVAGTTFKMFKSWKRSEFRVHELTTKAGLKIKTLGKSENSGMIQYLIQTADPHCWNA
ncbi:hypothetical protein F53441_9686 [Fusarium austroafricanum]|uniref:Histidine-specific methyltransferase SAM-dependent domain-containing protein n=1 Tax=Fusarium austroafricanum TaxID=2364996 RepID=A0A8H4K8N4_9HYPO|nr:hypothetical protein F53441_9686 [Fusarium austroafricanum]